MAIEFVQATHNDSLAVGTILSSSWKAAYEGILPDEFLQSLSGEKRGQRFSKDLSRHPDLAYYLLLKDKTAIGVCALHPSRDIDLNKTIEIGVFYLLPDHWGTGAGRIMFDKAFQLITTEATYNSISLWVLAQNSRARKFYEKLGFKHDGTIKEINRGVLLTELRYIRPTHV